MTLEFSGVAGSQSKVNAVVQITKQSPWNTLWMFTCFLPVFVTTPKGLNGRDTVRGFTGGFWHLQGSSLINHSLDTITYFS
jgi:hypothetical protein